MNEYRVWRISLQVCAMQTHEYKNPFNSPDQRLEWKQRILETLFKINQIAQEFKPQGFPTDIPCPVSDFLAPNAKGNWCEEMTRQLTHLFGSATPADTMKIDQIYTV